MGFVKIKVLFFSLFCLPFEVFQKLSICFDFEDVTRGNSKALASGFRILYLGEYRGNKPIVI